MWNPIRYLLERIGERNPLLLSHHPTCTHYSHHTIDVYDRKLCMGCFIVYPVGISSLLALGFIRVLRPESGLFAQPTVVFYLVGFALTGPMIASKLIPGRRSSSTRIVGKALLAIGLSVLFVPILVRPDDRLLTIGLFVGFLVSYTVYKGLTATDDCQGCPEADEFPNCSGMTIDGSER